MTQEYPSLSGIDCDELDELEELSLSTSTNVSLLEQTTEWEPTPKANGSFQVLNTFLSTKQLGVRSVSPVQGQLHVSFDKASSSTRSYYRRKAREVVGKVLETISPGQSELLLTDMMSTRYPNDSSEEQSKDIEQNLENRLILLYNQAESWYARQQILSLFVNQHTKTQLIKMIPGLTIWRIDQARQHAKNEGSGKPVDIPKIQRSRLDPLKVDHFLDFISSPVFHQDVAFGTKTIKLSNENIEIPNMVRTVISTRIVSLYQSFCKENDFQPLGKSTLFNILSVSMIRLYN